jgi:heme-degrading monooxygenase HmoA
LTSEEVRVLVYHQADDASSLRAAYREVSLALGDVPGLLGNELLESVVDPTGFVVASRWADLDAFSRWEQGPDHRRSTASLRPYRDPRLAHPFGVYRVTRSYPASLIR